MPKVAALVDAHGLRAFVVIPKACSSLGLVHPATTTSISFFYPCFLYCSCFVSLLLRWWPWRAEPAFDEASVYSPVMGPLY